MSNPEISKLQGLAFIFILVATVIFLRSYYHYMYLQADEITSARVIANILATLNPAEPATEHSMVAGQFYVTEHRAMQFWFLVSGLLTCLAVLLNSLERVRSGSTHFFIPIMFLSLVWLGGMVNVAHEIGMFEAW